MLKGTQLSGFGAATAGGAGVIPVIEATNTSQETTNVTSHTVSLPASVASGDLLLIAFAPRGASAGTSTPSGWTLLTTAEASGTENGTLITFYKSAAGGETTETITTSSSVRSTHCTYRISGWNAIEGDDATASDATTIDPPSLNVSWGAKNTLWISACGCGRPRATFSVPSGWTDSSIEIKGTIGNNGHNMCGMTANTGLGTTTPQNPGTWGMDANVSGGAATIGVEPA